MQQHTGQHILSAAFENAFDIQTISSRLGEDFGTIDLSKSPTEDELINAVELSNKVVQENREVIIHFADKSTINSYKLRKPPKVEGTVRIVEVKDFDLSPCGGTHCTHTSEVGVILTGNTEKVKSSLTRIEFACGNRAVRNYYNLHRSAAKAAHLLSSTAFELPNATEKLKDQIREKDSELKGLSEKYLGTICEELRKHLDSSSEKFNVIDLTNRILSADQLRYVASCLSKQAMKSFMVFKNDTEICQANLNLLTKNANAIMDRLRIEFDVKGGGRNGFFTLNFDRDKFGPVVKQLIKDVLDG